MQFQQVEFICLPILLYYYFLGVPRRSLKDDTYNRMFIPKVLS